MKIILDPQIYNLQQNGGISRYYTEVFSVLSKNKENRIIVPLNNSNNVYFKNSNLNSFKQKTYVYLIKIFKKIKLNKKFKLDCIPENRFVKILAKQNYDLFIPTYYDMSFLQYIGNKPIVLTVYDMIHELFPEYFIEDESTVKNKLLLMERADRIIAVSENTKKDILNIYPHINESKIHVVYHGISVRVKDNVQISLPENYILFVGNRMRYKNFLFFISSISELLKSNVDLYLVCAGGGKFNEEENEYINKQGLGNKIIQKYFNDDELGFFYKNAKCFVFPSKYEGFGLPVIESMACGCPVVLGHHSSFPEVAGRAGVYFELDNSEDLLLKITDLLYNESIRNDFSQRGIEQAKKFNWENAAFSCMNVYQKACKSNENIK